jgi:hypothetical protein
VVQVGTPSVPYTASNLTDPKVVQRIKKKLLIAMYHATEADHRTAGDDNPEIIYWIRSPFINRRNATQRRQSIKKLQLNMD